MKIVLITGITGQDGSYLAELLLSKNYKVHGIIRRHSNINTIRIDHIFSQLHLHYGDMTDPNSIHNIITLITNSYDDIEIFEIYNLAAQSHVKVSFEIPEYTADVDGLGTLRILECIRQSPIKDKIRFYQASTSELYGKVLTIPQNEITPFNPQSPYAISKLYSYWIVKNYREAYNIFACNGILFNHTSPRRGETFICRKITKAVYNIKHNKQKKLVVGNLYSKRDLGHAKDYVYGMWLMLQHSEPDDFVLSMDITYSVKEIIEMAFEIVDIKLKWENEIGKDANTDQILVTIDPKYFRPTEVDILLGDSQKARNILKWCPTYNLNEILSEMINFEKNY